MPIKTPVKRPYFRRVDAAKAKIAAKIDTYIALHEKAARNAAERGNSAPVEWLLSHAEILEDDGSYHRPISGSVDRPQGDSKAPGTNITIGFLGSAPPNVTITEAHQPAQDERAKELWDVEKSADAPTPTELLAEANLGCEPASE